MFRLRNIVADVVRELLKMMGELHEPGRVKAAATQINFQCCRQAVRSAEALRRLLLQLVLLLVLLLLLLLLLLRLRALEASPVPSCSSLLAVPMNGLE